MTEAPFTFDYDAGKRILRVRMGGFWSLATLHDFRHGAANVLQEALKRGATVGGGYILVLAQHFPVQEKSLTEDIGQLIPAFGGLAKRIAIVSSDSAVQRLQFKRLLNSDNARLFEDEAAATEWLFAD